MSNNSQISEKGKNFSGKAKVLSYVIILAICGLIAFGVLKSSGGLDAYPDDMEFFLRKLCDAFFVPGIFVGGLGLLVVLASEGAFDALAYSARIIFVMPFKKKPEKYYDYKMRKSEKPKSNVWFLLISGLICVVIAVVILIIYSNMGYIE